MKKKSTKIIFETREIWRIHIGTTTERKGFIEPPAIQNDWLLRERRVGFKTRWREKLREFWKSRNRIHQAKRNFNGEIKI